MAGRDREAAAGRCAVSGLPFWQERGGAWFLRMRPGASIVLEVWMIGAGGWMVKSQPLGRRTMLGPKSAERAREGAIACLGEWLAEAKEAASGKIETETPPQGGPSEEPK